MTTEIARVAPTPSLGEMVRYAEHLAHADLLPKQFAGKPANVLYALEYGRTLGITPMAAITGIHVIEGKPSASSGLIGGLVRQAGHKLRVKGDDRQAVAQIIRADDPDWTYESTWTLDRAVTAGLCQLKDGKPWARDRNGKPTSWEKYPNAMLKARAITEVARDACEDVLYGLHYTPEELGVYVDQEGNPVDGPAQPVYIDTTGQRPSEQVVEQRSAEQAAAAEPVIPPEQKFAEDAAHTTDLEVVRRIYREAAAANLLLATAQTPLGTMELRAYLAARGQQLALVAEESAPAPRPVTADDVLDAEIVDPSPYEEALDALRATAVMVGLTPADLEEGFQTAYGTPVAGAHIDNLRAMNNTLRSNT